MRVEVELPEVVCQIQQKLESHYHKLLNTPTPELESAILGLIAERDGALKAWFLSEWQRHHFEAVHAAVTQAAAKAPAAPEVPKARPVEAPIDLAQLQAQMREPGWKAKKAAGRAEADAALERLIGHVERMGPPPIIPLEMSPERRRSVLNNLCNEMAGWKGLEPDVLVPLLRWAAAEHQMVLAAQPVGNDSREVWRFKCMKTLADLPGVAYIHGLSRSHQPKGVGWTHDAAQAWAGLIEALGDRRLACKPEAVLARVERAIASREPPAIRVAVAMAPALGLPWTAAALLRCLTPVMSHLQGASFRDLQQPPALSSVATPAPEPSAGAEAAEPAEAEEALEGEETPLPAFTQPPSGRAMMIGGEPRERARKRLQAGLNLETLAWHSISASVDPLVRQIEQGSVDVVFVLHGFCAHRVSDRLRAACKLYAVAYAPVTHGYGLGQMQQAWEKAQEWMASEREAMRAGVG